MSWISTENFIQSHLQQRYQTVMRKIEEEYKAKKEEEVRLVLIHPTPYTNQLLEVSERNPTFRKQCTSIQSGIDVFEMYQCALREKMGMIGDDEMEQLCGALATKFGETETYQRLVKLVTSVVETGETFSWIPYTRPESGYVPSVPREYVVVYVDPLDEWVSRDLNNAELDLVFLQEPSPFLLHPRSTVGCMMERCRFMDQVTENFLRASHFACTPSYLVSDRDRGEESNKGGARNNPLDPKMVNQSRVNEQLENMIASNLQASSFAGSNSQRSTSVRGKLNSFVSELGARYVNDARENRQLQRDVKELTDRLEQMTERNKEPGPRRWTVPHDMEVSGCQLGVTPFVDLLSLQRRHDAEWTAVCLGHSIGSMHSNRLEGQGDREMEFLFLRRKQRRYALVLLFTVLREWMQRSGIRLGVPPHLLETMPIGNPLQG